MPLKLRIMCLKSVSNLQVYKILVAPRDAKSMETGFHKTTQDIGNLDLESGMMVNPSQLEAVKLAMTKSLALIQGPPGKFPIFDENMKIFTTKLLTLEKLSRSDICVANFKPPANGESLGNYSVPKIFFSA